MPRMSKQPHPLYSWLLRKLPNQYRPALADELWYFSSVNRLEYTHFNKPSPRLHLPSTVLEKSFPWPISHHGQDFWAAVHLHLHRVEQEQEQHQQLSYLRAKIRAQRKAHNKAVAKAHRFFHELQRSK